MNYLQFVTFLLLGIGLSFDSFAVSVSFGIMKREIRFQQACFVAFFLAFFQAAFPILGWLIGMSLKNLISAYDHWIAFVLLSLIGIKMINEGMKPFHERQEFNPMQMRYILGISVATSIDALIVGLSFGFMDTNIFLPSGIIGAVTFIAAMLGMLFGKNISGKKSQRSIIVGGIILILIGLKILAEHVFSFS